MLMQRLTIAEADIATLKQDYTSLKTNVDSSSAESKASESEITALEKKMKLDMMPTVNMMSGKTMSKGSLKSNLVG